jgi:capsular polysaccharide export protein
VTLAFLRIPPFPGHRAPSLALPEPGQPPDRRTTAELLELLQSERVGGDFWAAQPDMPNGRDILLAPCTAEQAIEMLKQARTEGLLDRCAMLASTGRLIRLTNPAVPMLSGPVDPWHLADVAGQVWAGADHEISIVAGIAGRSHRIFRRDRFADINDADEDLARSIAQRIVQNWTYRCPFTEQPVSAVQAARILSDWRRLIDRNRDAVGIAGVAAWKRSTVDALLWAGNGNPRYLRRVPEAMDINSNVIAWKSRTSKSALTHLCRRGVRLAELEDGLIRGPGLGANCVPPLSVVVDYSGIYFDPSQPSDLEQILELARIDGELLDRAARLRERIVASGISKYGGDITSRRWPANVRRILVVGQVEDDRSILSGGGGQTNLELLQRARSIEPDAWVIYRPHPDVEAGHRKGYVPDEVVLSHADEIDRGGSIASLIKAVDGIHCITSLAGFEAMMRGKQVTTHGVPFYAGWGLTRDLGPVPTRRTRRRLLDELVAAALILYPRYLDPVTRLPCPPEVLVDRIACGRAEVAAPLAGVRKLQGKFKLVLRWLQRGAA